MSTGVGVWDQATGAVWGMRLEMEDLWAPQELGVEAQVRLSRVGIRAGDEMGIGTGETKKRMSAGYFFM